MPAALSSTAITFAGSTYACASVNVREGAEQLDVTVLTDTRKKYQASPLKNAAEASLEFMGYGPRSGATGAFTAPGVSGIGATVVSSSTTFQVGNVIKSSASLQFSR